MEVNKYDLEGGIRAMRLVVQMLTIWADDLEASGKAGHRNGGDDQPFVSGMTPERRATLENEMDAALAVPAAPDTPAAPAEPVKFEQVQQAMTILCATNLRPRVEALVLSYGVCLSVIPKEKYGELMAAAEEMAREAGIDLSGGDEHG